MWCRPCALGSEIEVWWPFSWWTADCRVVRVQAQILSVIRQSPPPPPGTVRRSGGQTSHLVAKSRIAGFPFNVILDMVRLTNLQIARPKFDETFIGELGSGGYGTVYKVRYSADAHGDNGSLAKTRK
jgi:hypothetical protein